MLYIEREMSSPLIRRGVNFDNQIRAGKPSARDLRVSRPQLLRSEEGSLQLGARRSAPAALPRLTQGLLARDHQRRAQLCG